MQDRCDLDFSVGNVLFNQFHWCTPLMPLECDKFTSAYEVESRTEPLSKIFTYGTSLEANKSDATDFFRPQAVGARVSVDSAVRPRAALRHRRHVGVQTTDR